MKNWFIGIIVILVGVCFAQWRQVKYANQKWEIAEANLKAYGNQITSANGKNIALQLTVDQLEYFKDSVLQELDSVRNELKIKDKNLKALHKVSSGFSKTDTITLRDTLFRDVTLNMDTIIGDEWYNLKLGLKYPSTISARPYFKSEKFIVVSSKKETVNPPKKFFLCRWLQKKMTVVHIDIIEKNPYVSQEESKYIEIIK